MNVGPNRSKPSLRLRAESRRAKLNSSLSVILRLRNSARTTEKKNVQISKVRKTAFFAPVRAHDAAMSLPNSMSAASAAAAEEEEEVELEVVGKEVVGKQVAVTSIGMAGVTGVTGDEMVSEGRAKDCADGGRMASRTEGGGGFGPCCGRDESGGTGTPEAAREDETQVGTRVRGVRDRAGRAGRAANERRA